MPDSPQWEKTNESWDKLDNSKQKNPIEEFPREGTAQFQRHNSKRTIPMGEFQRKTSNGKFQREDSNETIP